MNTAKMWLILMLGAAAMVESRQFTREPTDTTTTVGDKAVLRFCFSNVFGDILMEWKFRCGVDSAASGPMQWTKDGFALGLDRSLPGWPNYSMLEDKEGTSSEAFRILFYSIGNHSFQDTHSPKSMKFS